MAGQNHIDKVAIIGGTGRLGRHFVEELLKTGRHTVTVLTRPKSTATVPKGAVLIRVDYNDKAAIANALKGQQFVTIAVAASTPPATHNTLAEAAVEAGVPYIMPAAYGADITNARLAQDDIYTKSCLGLVQEIEKLGGTYTVLTCGFWYEWGLLLGESFFGFSIKERKVTFYDDGNTKVNSSTWGQCGRALAALLSLPESGTLPAVSGWKNRSLRVSSFRISQRDMLDSLHRILGTSDKDWEISFEPTEKRAADGLAALGKGDRSGFAKAMYARMFFPNGDGDYETSAGLDNEAIGLELEDLDDATRKVVEMLESGWTP
ncbi:NAD(P)-binding protein [Thozetella sp. PMI_491]|nr:NAD(P)-binding protein [Thozetella sp. PMI_491]